MKKQYFLLTLFLYSIAVFYLAATTPISPHEAKILYTSKDIVAQLMQWGQTLYSGFLGLRLLFIPFAFLSVLLFFLLSRHYFKKSEDAYLSTVIFILLPGILTASTLANIAILVLPLVLLFVLLYEKNYFFVPVFIMLTLFFIHDASIIFFVALFLYGLTHRDNKLTIFSSVFLIAFISMAKGIEIGGHPSGHFVEIFGLYAALFSPLLFLFFFYAMYRTLLREKKTLLWYISFTALAFSLMLSLRQRVAIADFAPYVMIAILLMLDVFNQSLRVRIPRFQKRYKAGFFIVMLFLVLSVSLVVFNKVSYLLMENPDRHFAKRIYKPYFLANALKSRGVECYDKARGKERYQLHYYGIKDCVE